MRILHDSISSHYRTPFGCVQQEQDCTLRLDVPKHCQTSQVFLILEQEDGTLFDRLPLTKVSESSDYDYFSLTFQLSVCDLYFYHFELITAESTFSLYRHGLHDTNIEVGDSWQITCYPKGYQTSSAFQGKVMYQIYPDRFHQVGNCDLTGKLEPYHLHQNKQVCPVFLPDEKNIIQNNDFFGGNLQGIREKLPYLAALNVGVVYLNPIFYAYSNHRYDTADYRRIDPLLGTEEDLIALCNDAHQLGMKILLDGVFSHTGCNSVYFDKYNLFGQGAYHNPDSPYRDWFQFASPDSKEYASWWGINTLPCVKELSDAFLDYIIRDEDSVIAHWMGCGVDGFRLDVADELPDTFIRLLHQRVHQEKQDSLVLGEVWEDASNKIAYSSRRRYFVDTELDSVMNYPYKDAIIGFVNGTLSAQELSETVLQIAEHYPEPVLHCLMNSLSTHDTMRILTVLGGKTDLTRQQKAITFLSEESRTLAMQQLQAAMFLQFCLPGCPCIYYGDEVGLEGYEDPFNRRYFPWDNQDETLLAYTQTLAQLKTNLPALAAGTIRILSDSEDIFLFERQLGSQTLLGLVSLKESYPCFIASDPLLVVRGTVQGHQVTLEKYGCLLLEVSL